MWIGLGNFIEDFARRNGDSSSGEQDVDDRIGMIAKLVGQRNSTMQELTNATMNHDEKGGIMTNSEAESAIAPPSGVDDSQVGYGESEAAEVADGFRNCCCRCRVWCRSPVASFCA